ncbi:uncharacterized protein [Watersipora subatra]|uniref:uncharacterized protein isoform X2 n=1 Tax=Watersipora subatra TaxID=2589382 RepID=UPI00355ADFEF
MDVYQLDYKQLEVVNIEKRQDVNQIEDYFMMFCLSERRELPQLWAGGKYVGNESKINHLHKDGQLSALFTTCGVSVPSINPPNQMGIADVSASEKKEEDETGTK